MPGAVSTLFNSKLIFERTNFTASLKTEALSLWFSRELVYNNPLHQPQSGNRIHVFQSVVGLSIDLKHIGMALDSTVAHKHMTLVTAVLLADLCFGKPNGTIMFVICSALCCFIACLTKFECAV